MRVLTEQSIRRALVLLGGALVGILLVGPACADEVKVFTPREPDHKGLSTAPEKVDPQLQKSLGLARRALGLTTGAGATQDLREAAQLAREAYFLQRAAHGGINKQARGRSRPGDKLDLQDRTIHASRQNLIAATGRLQQARPGDAKARAAMEFLSAAIRQTQDVLGLRR